MSYKSDDQREKELEKDLNKQARVHAKRKAELKSPNKGGVVLLLLLAMLLGFWLIGKGSDQDMPIDETTELPQKISNPEINTPKSHTPNEQPQVPVTTPSEQLAEDTSIEQIPNDSSEAKIPKTPVKKTPQKTPAKQITDDPPSEIEVEDGDEQVPTPTEDPQKIDVPVEKPVDEKPIPREKEKATQSPLVVTDWKWRNDTRNIAIEGVVKNNSNKTYKRVRIIITARDGNDKFLGVMEVHLRPSTIPPGGTSIFTYFIFNTKCPTKDMKIEYQFD